MTNNDKTLLEILNDESLSHQLTSTNIKDRQKALETLIECMKARESKTSTLELSALIDFFASKCQKDHHSLYPYVIEAYSWLLIHPLTDSQSITGGLRVFFNEIQIQSQVREDRIKIFKMLHQILLISKDKIKNMHQEFIMGYLLAVEGETDPEGLLIIFRTWPMIMDSFQDAEHLIEDIFEVISCYFPIDLRGHGEENNDNNKQLEDTLKLSLRHALTSSVQFAPLTIPFLIEKSSTHLQSTQNECIYTLTALCSANTCPPAPSVFRPHLASLWKNLLIKGFNEEKANLLSAICNHIYPSFEVYEELLYNVISPDLKRDLCASSHSQDEALKVLKVLTHSPIEASELVLKEFLPLLLQGDLINNKLNLIGGIFSTNVKIEVEVIKFKILDNLTSDNRASMAIQALLNGALHLFKNAEGVEKNLLIAVENLIYKYPNRDLARLVALMNVEERNNGDELRSKILQLNTQERIIFVEYLILEQQDSLFIPFLLLSMDLRNISVIESFVRLCKASTSTLGYLRREILSDLIQMSDKTPGTLELISILVNEEFLLQYDCAMAYDSAILEALWCGVDPKKMNLASHPIYEKVVMSMKSEDEPLLRLRSSFINKDPPDIQSLFQNEVSIVCMAWMVKGLLLKGTTLKKVPYFDSLLNKIQTESDSIEIFDILTQDMKGCYKHCEVSPLYRQKLYCWTVDFLINNKYLRALMMQVLHLPLFVYSDHLPQIFTLLKERMDDKEVLQPALEMTSLVLKDKEELMNKELMQDLILMALKSNSTTSVHNRIVALKCIPMLKAEDPMSLLSKALNSALMDSKRIVRKTAVEVKNTLMINKDVY